MSGSSSTKTTKKSLTSSSNLSNQSSSASASKGQTMDQLIQLMSQINSTVKAGEFNTQLAGHIFSLCQHLKNNGQQLELSHKSDLNKVFVSLRQACCRDNGKLGTPCRLKIMELIELRAMGWKTNLAHTQYYLNKAEKVNGQSDSTPQQPTFSSTSKSQASFTNSSKSTNVQSLFNGPPPQQQTKHHQPVYHHQPVNIQPQQFGQGNFAQPPPPLYLPAEIAANPQPMASGAPGYFLIPTAGAWTPQMIPTSMLHSPQFVHRQPPPNQMQPPPDWMARNAAIAAVSAHFGKIPPNAMSQSAYVPGSSANSKSSKQPQFREEVTIRNSDSGKIMGVKGRRVAGVEEISKTVISFQKVDNNSRYRTLAITGTNQESILHAKRLIEETIKRNVSPNRLDLNEQTQTNNVPPSKVLGEEAPIVDDVIDDEEEEDDPSISIEANTDGSLKVSCADPEMLQAAQQALTEYLNLRSNRMTAEERELRKERRKSMPLQSSSTANAIAQPTIPQSVSKAVEETIKIEPNGSSLSESRKVLTGSTPNLLADSLEEPKPEVDNDVLRYERDKMLSVRDQVQTQINAWTTVTNDSSDSNNKSGELPYTTATEATDPEKN